MLKLPSFETGLDEEIGDNINDLTLYRDMYVVVPLNQTKMVYFYNTRTIEECYQLVLNNLLNTVAVHPTVDLLVSGGGLDPKLVATTAEGNVVTTQFFDFKHEELVMELTLHGGPTHMIRWFPDGLGLVSVAEDGSIVTVRFDDELLKYKFRDEWLE